MIPSPRTAADDVEARAHYLAACAHVWDHGREASRANMVHGASMILGKFGGTLVLRAESTPTRRTIPEAGFYSEGAGTYGA